MPKLPIFLINLKGSDARLYASRTQIHDAGFTFERIEAVDGRGQKTHSFAQYDDLAARMFFGRSMTSGEVGCYLSHVAAARAVVESGADYGLVLEDDFKAQPGAWVVLEQTIERLKRGQTDDWDMVNLARSPRSPRAHLSSFCEDSVNATQLLRAYYFPVIATAILWSRLGAQRFIAQDAQPIGPVDHIYRHRMSESGRGLALSPPPFGVTGVESDIVGASGGFKPPRFYYGVWRLWRSEISRQVRCTRRAYRNKYFRPEQ